jgi:hypothetical protein
MHAPHTTDKASLLGVLDLFGASGARTLYVCVHLMKAVVQRAEFGTPPSRRTATVDSAKVFPTRHPRRSPAVIKLVRVRVGSTPDLDSQSRFGAIRTTARVDRRAPRRA